MSEAGDVWAIKFIITCIIATMIFGLCMLICYAIYCYMKDPVDLTEPLL